MKNAVRSFADQKVVENYTISGEHMVSLTDEYRGDDNTLHHFISSLNYFRCS